MKYAVTGGAGFIGSHLCEQLLKNKHDITILTRHTTNLRNISHILDKLTVKTADVTDHTRLGNCIDKIKPDVIIHLAGNTTAPRRGR